MHILLWWDTQWFFFLHLKQSWNTSYLQSYILVLSLYKFKAWFPRNRISSSIKSNNHHLYYRCFQTLVSTAIHTHRQWRRCHFNNLSVPYGMGCFKFCKWGKNWHLVKFTFVSLTAVRLSISSYTLAICIFSAINLLFIVFAHFSIEILAFSDHISNICQIVLLWL